MKPNSTHITLIFFYLFAIPILIAQEKPLVYTPGPANLNPDTFAHIYFLREQDDDFPDNWLAVILNDDAGFCVKAKMNHVYRVHTKLTDTTKLHTKIKNAYIELNLILQPGNDYYVSLKPEQNTQGLLGSLKLLDNAEGKARLQAYTGHIQDRYCIVPMTGNYDFRENIYNDTIPWYADKTHNYLFRPLPSWEILGQDSPNTAFAFRNPLISNTYSEAGGITSLSLKKCATIEAFDNYCNTTFIKTILDKQHDTLTGITLTPVSLPKGISYARMLAIENKNTSAMLPETTELLMRSVHIVFFWTDEKGKGNTASMYLSERGLPNELHNFSTLQDRLLWVWHSFKLVNIK
ncbi:hypothetical protein NO995_02425 [Aestuariibaculum sp. M13]|uniref:hypothetical protein n=1 Tax=Aestuariibaculum sp. M13 TaxID=2967132 RepID=UPI00215A0016|nr:hypothetical protein [Aestuariibaculum sp. M13]MCR8666520.1 hypothetical protein [Aestuariibaculum sp. M13]